MTQTIRLRPVKVNSQKKRGGQWAAPRLLGWLMQLGGGAADAHAVERAVDEDRGDDEEGSGQDVGQAVAMLAGGELHGELDGKKAEERGELDDGVESDGGGVLEGIAYGVADDRGVMERRTFLFQ